MVDTYSVATVLTLNDELIVGLRAAADVADRLDAALVSIERRLGAFGRGSTAGLVGGLDEAKAAAVTLGDSLKTLQVAPGALADVRGLSRALGTAERRAAGLKATLADLAIPAGAGVAAVNLAGALPAPRGSAAGAEERSQGPHIRASAPLPGGMHASGILSPEAAVGVGIAGTAAYGAYKEARLRDEIMKMLFTAGLPLEDGTMYQRLRGELLDISTKTGAPIGEVAESGLGITRMLSGFPMEQRAGVFDAVITAAVEEHRLKGDVGVPQAAEAIVGMLHQARIYDPKAIEGAIGSYLYASIVSPQNIGQIGRAASYATPVLRAGIGYDPVETTMLMAQLQQSGISSTKAGTWEERGLEGLLPDTVNLTSHAAKMHMAGLKRLGLVDEGGKSTILDEQGRPSLTRELTAVSQALERIPQRERMAVLKQVGQQQGSRFLAIATDPQFIEQRERLSQEAHDFTRWREFFSHMFGASPVQQAEQAAQGLSRLDQDIGVTVLAPFSTAVTTATAALEGLNAWAEKHGALGTAAQLGVTGALAGTLYAGWQGLKALWHGASAGCGMVPARSPARSRLARQ